MESALIGCPTVGIVRFNSDWLSSKTQDNLCRHNFSGALNRDGKAVRDGIVHAGGGLGIG